MQTGLLPVVIVGIDMYSVAMCHWCKKKPVAWLCRWDVCRHTHLICDKCKDVALMKERMAHEATPPRAIGPHKCCGTQIYHVELRPM